MDKKTFSSLLEGKIFRIPDYQRGYAWDTKQWEDFVLDIDALIDDEINSHYTGTIVIYHPKKVETEEYGVDKFSIIDVVDGQQRLITCSLYLSIILHELIYLGEIDYKSKLPLLYERSKSRIRLNNETTDFYYDLITKGNPNIQATNIHQRKLLEAYNYLKSHIEKEKWKRGDISINYLKSLFYAITRKLNFSFYTIEEESEIGMTFELMNSRGKDLSSLELLKNYFMHWVYRNGYDSDRDDLTNTINKAWKEVYVNIEQCNGNENQCLRIAWILYHSHDPKKWSGYSGFKSPDTVPLRDFSIKTKEDTQRFIQVFTNGLAEISKHYSSIISPSINNGFEEEFTWLSKIINAGNIANYLPLIVATRKGVFDGKIAREDYISLLKAVELFSYRVFLWAGKRSNTGKSKFYHWASDIFSNKHSVKEVTEWILGSINWYSNENSFREELKERFFDWYRWKKLLIYTLYEYELKLLNSEGKGAEPKLLWNDLNDSTLEHILPIQPSENSEWNKKWSDKDFNSYIHDISNIVLTRNNSNYRNFEFAKKKGKPGTGYCYANSDIRQERKIAEFDDWTVESCKERRNILINWIIERWGINKYYKIPEEVIEIKEDEEIMEE